MRAVAHTGDGGAYGLLEVHVAAGALLPPHVCSATDVTLFVVEGSVDLTLGPRRRRIDTGTSVPVPRGLPRSLEAATDAHLLWLGLPAGLERLAVCLNDHSLDPDDAAALLAAAGVSLLPWLSRGRGPAPSPQGESISAGGPSPSAFGSRPSCRSA